jgi:tRNA threonylcarbamoyladenosine biosynthesis protein TsaB
MRGLVIDTALGLCTVAAFEDDRLLAVRSEAMTRGHQERLGGFLREVADKAGGFASLDRIGVTVGPGSFTGLRVGLAFAQGLGAALDRPVVGVSALDALRASAADAQTVAALIDARRGQVYARFWRDGAPVAGSQALNLEDAVAHIADLGEGAVLVGTGAPLLADRFPANTCLPFEGPSPEALAALVRAADPASHPPRPLYLRAPDAIPPTRLPGQPRPDRT